MRRILVTGAGGSPAFNYIKSLRENPKKEKFYIVGIDKNKFHLELTDSDSKYLIPNKFNSKNDYLKFINKIIVKEKIDFIHCQPEEDVLFFSESKRKLKAKSFLPKLSTIKVCQNKAEFNYALKKKNISVPEAYHLKSKRDLKKSVGMILKNNNKVWIRAIKGAGSRAAIPIVEYDQAKMWINYWTKMKGLKYDDFMVSEFLPGKEYAFQSVWLEGKLLMSQARERVEYLFGNLFVSGQSSSPSVAVTVNNEKVNSMSYQAIKAIDEDATGVFCVDLKTDKNGRVLITEINAGRFFTTSYFFSKAGCNMPYYYTKLGLGDINESPFKKFDNIKKGLYWIRMIDMGQKLVDDNWGFKKL